MSEIPDLEISFDDKDLIEECTKKKKIVSVNPIYGEKIEERIRVSPPPIITKDILENIMKIMNCRGLFFVLVDENQVNHSVSIVNPDKYAGAVQSGLDSRVGNRSVSELICAVVPKSKKIP